MIRHRITGLLASLLILVIIIGLPLVLYAVGGNPIPTELPSLVQVIEWFTSPDDGTLALGALTIVGWLVWGFLTISIVAELVVAIRGVRAPTLPGLRIPQDAAHRLVAAAALLFVTAPAASLTNPAFAAENANPPHVSAQALTAAQSVRLESSTVTLAQSQRPDHKLEHMSGRTALLDHVVQPADTLSGIADTYLGGPDKWPEIFEASRGLTQPDGSQLTNPDLIEEGWTLRIPAGAAEAVAREGMPLTDHEVQPAETLSSLAQTLLGDADRWPEIFEASRNVIQPDGQQLTNPDMIFAGWHLRIPASNSAPTAAVDVTTTPATLPRPDPCATPQLPANQQAAGPSTRANPAPGATSAPSTSPAPSSTATPQATNEPRVSAAPPTPATSAPTQPAAPEVQDAEATADAPWLLTGLSTGGLVLASGALLTLRRRRRQQFRERHPGRAIASPEPRLVPVEKTTTAVGTKAETTVRFMDEVLRRMAASLMSDGQQMPSLSAVELRADGSIVLHLAEPAALVAPWVARDAASTTWQLPTGANPTAVGYQYEDQPAPYPLLVTCGCTDAGDLWLANLEQLGAVRVTGNPVFRSDYLRYVVAELAVNPWSLNTTITCTGMDDLAPLSPERVRTAPRIEDAVEQLSFRATATNESVTELHTDSATARVAQLAEEVWGARILIADGDFTDEPRGMSALIDVITTNQGKTSAAVVASETAMPRGLEFEFTDHGRVTIPDLGIDLIAVGLTQDEALGCAALLSVGTATQDTAMPANDDEEGWRALADQAGALREDLTVPRSTPDTEPVICVIDEDDPLPDSAIEADLDALDPKVPTDVRTIVEQADPALDEDVTDWFSESCTRPRLSLLGPVTVRAHGAAIAKRKPFYTEVLSYIALRQRGATTDELATALGYTNLTTVRTAVKAVRDWLGTNPRTSLPHLPAANATEAAKQRGIAAYQVEDLLIDVDLFRRLRVRGQSRGADGIGDLVTALRLVTGRPFDQLRTGGWSWLADTGTDHHMVCAIVDVAHLLCVHFFQAGELDQARAATETALFAAPYDDIPKLDLAAIRKAEGHLEESRRIITEDVCNSIEDDGLPAEIGQRTVQVLAGDNWEWLKPRRGGS